MGETTAMAAGNGAFSRFIPKTCFSFVNITHAKLYWT